jgi:hypothetical protein
MYRKSDGREDGRERVERSLESLCVVQYLGNVLNSNMMPIKCGKFTEVCFRRRTQWWDGQAISNAFCQSIEKREVRCHRELGVKEY